MKICLLIPTYNCADFIAHSLNDVLTSLSSSIDLLLIIDNNSSDSTIDIIQQQDITSFKIPTLVYKNNTNIGLGGSYKAAFALASSFNCTHLAIYFGDAQGTASDLRSIINSAEFRDNCADFYCLSRFHSKSQLRGYSMIRIYANKLFNLFFSLLYHSTVSDLGGYGIFNVQSVLKLPFHLMTNTLGFSYDLLSFISLYRMSIIIYPATWSDFGQTSNVRIIEQTIKFFVSTVKIRYFTSKSHIKNDIALLSSYTRLQYSTSALSGNSF